MVFFCSCIVVYFAIVFLHKKYMGFVSFSEKQRFWSKEHLLFCDEKLNNKIATSYIRQESFLLTTTFWLEFCSFWSFSKKHIFVTRYYSSMLRSSVNLWLWVICNYLCIMYCCFFANEVHFLPTTARTISYQRNFSEYANWIFSCKVLGILHVEFVES